MRDLWLVAFSLFTWGAGEGLFLYFQTIYLDTRFDASPVAIGAILGAVGLAGALSHIPAGYLADRIGPRPLMWASWLLGTVAIGLMAIAEVLPIFIIGSVLYGITMFVMAPMNSYVSAVRGNWSVSRALTMVSGLYNLGAVSGPLIGGVIAESLGIQATYRVAFFIVCLSTLVIFFIRHQPPLPQERGAARRELLTNPRFLIFAAVMFLSLFMLFLPQPLTPNYLEEVQQLNLSQIGGIGSIASLGNALIMLGLGGLSPFIGLLAGQILIGGSAFLFWQGTGLREFSVAYFLIGGHRLFRLMMLAFSRRLFSPALTGLAYGMLETVNGVVIILAPLAAGALYASDPQLIYILCLLGVGITMLLNIVVLLPLQRRTTDL